MSRTSLGCTLLLAFVGCTANVPDGRFHCEMDSECPSGLTCVDHHCYHPGAGPDAGSVGLDAGQDAAVLPDSGPIDAGPCTAPDCVTLTVTNAYGDAIVSGASFSIEGRAMTVPAFGGTSDSISISLGGNGHLDLHTQVGDISLMANAHMTYALVLGHDPNPMAMLPVGRLLPATFTTPSAGQFNVYPIDMMQDPTRIAITDGVTLNPLDPMTDGGVFRIDVGSRTPITLHQFQMDGVTPDVMIADFDASELPSTGAYYVVLAGRIDAHLGGPQGVRMIAVVPGMHLLESWPVVFVLNVADGHITLCEGSSAIGAGVDSQKVLQGIPSFSRATPAGEAMAIGLSSDGTCPATAGHTAQTPLPTATTVVGRALLVVEGLVTGMWGGAAGLESPPGGPMARQVVTYANGAQTAVANFGSMLMPNRTGPVVAQGGIGYLEWMMPPADLRIAYRATDYDYHWDLTSSTAAVLFITDDTANFIAYEMDSSFGQPWMLTIHMPGT